ncbi:MAG: DUF2799 domain-containing protein [Aeromonas sp.]
MRFYLIGWALLLSGCVSNGDDSCQADWRAVGEADGKLGLTAERFSFHQQQCPVQVDAALWRKGYQVGLAWYCRPEHLYIAGRAGEAYLGVCPNHKQAERLFSQGRQGWGDQ